MKSRSFLLFLGMLSLLACKTRQPLPIATVNPSTVSSQPNTEAAIRKGELTTLPYRPSVTKAFELIHTELEVDFDWEKERMNGNAVLTIRPWFDAQDHVIFDAKGFLIHEVKMASEGDKNLPYDYDNAHLSIDLGRKFTQKETLRVQIRYTARPSELDSLVSEEDANDQGLYFVNANGKDTAKPQEIWTQGESHGSPGWFPTFDTPNQRCTSKIAITVPDSFKTLSNGILVSSKYDPTRKSRTDTWEMNQAHSPYLFMMAIGKYAVVEDMWRGKKVNYYVEPKYAPYAKLIFGNTTEMLEFFSNKLGVDYPWPKYSQVVVRDFVSGAMENTSATTHFERLQHDSRQHLENTYEDIVSHELFHQWFGDLVTCESWANLSLNEGFATYGEVLWEEYKYGADEAMAHHLADRTTYLRSATRQKLPIIRYHYQAADDLFDANSYQKGGQVLHMLRKMVGDDAFFASLKYYLEQNQYLSVEIHQLRLAFEHITGQDLNWFFDQWYLRAGHPTLTIEHKFIPGKYSIHVQQVQDLASFPLFRLPITVEFVQGERRQRLEVWLESADTTFEFSVNNKPDYVVIDPEKDLLIEIKKETRLDPEEWFTQAMTGQGFQQKQEALIAMDLSKLSDEQFSALLSLQKDAFWGTRNLLLNTLEKGDTQRKVAALAVANVFLHDPKALVRITAVNFIRAHFSVASIESKESLKSTLFAAIQDSAYTVSQLSLESYFAMDPAAGLQLAEDLSQKNIPHLIGMIARVLRESGSPKALPFICKNVQDPKIETGAKIALVRGLGEYLKSRTEEEKSIGLAMLIDLVRSTNARWLRFTAMQSLGEIEKSATVRSFFEERSTIETDVMIQSIIKKYMDQK